MTTGEFADLVQKMRDAQKNYFKTHRQDYLELSKSYEKKVDSALAERNKREQERLNPGLFDSAGAENA